MACRRFGGDRQNKDRRAWEQEVTEQSKGKKDDDGGGDHDDDDGEKKQR